MSKPVTYSTREQMAVVLARQLQDGETVVGGGVRSAVPMAAMFLAQRHQAPNLVIVLGMGVVNPPSNRIWASAGDARYAVGCEGYVSMDEIFELSEAGKFDVAFYGGLQIDRFGNANLTWVQAGDRRVRGPGVANATLAVTAKRTLLYSEHHDPRVFVDHVDFDTLPGHVSEGGRPHGLPGGPEACVTPLGVFEFPRPLRSMSVRSLHSDVRRDAVERQTGFALRWPEETPYTRPPSTDELRILRELDPDGLLRE